MQVFKLDDKKGTQMIAHRGLSGMEIENTVLAFVAAGNRSYYGAECDVHVTADGKYVIFHDDSTGRLCKKDLVIEKTGFDELRSLEFKCGNAQIPTLEEYLDIVARYEKVAVIELKNRMDEKNILEIVDICKSRYDLDKVIFISFDFDNLATVRRRFAKQKIQLLTDGLYDGAIADLKKYGFGLDAEQGILTAELVKELHANGIAVNCWTCNDPENAEKLIEMGVDFITTDALE